MKIEEYEDLWECHECGARDVKCIFIEFDNLCQHFVSLCKAKCYPKFKKMIKTTRLK